MNIQQINFNKILFSACEMCAIVVRFAHCVFCVLTWAALRIIEDIRDNTSNEYSYSNQRPSIIRSFSATFHRDWESEKQRDEKSWRKTLAPVSQTCFKWCLPFLMCWSYLLDNHLRLKFAVLLSIPSNQGFNHHILSALMGFCY